MRSPDRWQHPTILRSITAVRGPGELNRTPTCTGPTSGPLRVRIEARQQRVASGETSKKTWRATSQSTFCGSSLASEVQQWSNREHEPGHQNHPLRNEVQ